MKRAKAAVALADGRLRPCGWLHGYVRRHDRGPDFAVDSVNNRAVGWWHLADGVGAAVLDPIATIPLSPETPGAEVLSPQESADRAAIEAQWTKLWQIYAALPHTPEADRQALTAQVAVDPALSNLLTDARTLNRRGGTPTASSCHASPGHSPSTARPRPLSPTARTQARLGLSRRVPATRQRSGWSEIRCRGPSCVGRMVSGGLIRSSISRTNRADRTTGHPDRSGRSAGPLSCLLASGIVSAGPQDDPPVHHPRRHLPDQLKRP